MIILSLLDKILRLFGTSERQLRWKLHLRRLEKERKADHRTNTKRHLLYQHKTCHVCGTIVHRNGKICPQCAAPQAAWSTKFAGKLIERILPRQGALTTALLATNGFVFIYTTYATGELWGMSGYTAIHFGAKYGPLITAGNEWWRLVTANFMHPGGLLHIAFNMYALMIVCPIIERWYGSSRATVLYLLSGIYSVIASHLVNPIIPSGGASGAILGLIGAGVVAGHLDRTSVGRDMRNRLLRWFLYIVAIGFIVPGIDNTGHIGGFVAGFLVGAGLIRPVRRSTRNDWVYRGLAAVAVALTITALVFGFLGDRGYPHESEHRSDRQLWMACWHQLSEGADAIEACDTFAHDNFYRDPLATELVAILLERADQKQRADRLRHISQASVGYPTRLFVPTGFDSDSAIEFIRQRLDLRFEIVEQ